jgi:hypothetical protein
MGTDNHSFFSLRPLTMLLTSSILCSLLPAHPVAGAESPSPNKEEYVDATKIRIKLKKPLELSYAQPRWNEKQDQVDRAYVLIKNTISGAVFAVEMVETAPNSGLFQSQISAAQAGQEEATFEIYLPLKNKAINSENLASETKLIQQGMGLRKPYFYRVENGHPKITIYDSKTQALDAYRYFVRFGQSRDVVSPNLLENQASSQMGLDEQGESLKKVEQLENELDERLKRKLEESSRLSDEELQKMKKQAEALAAQGLEDYKQGQYAEAAAKFEKSLDLVPSQKSFLLEAGASYYRLGDYEKCIAYLNLAETEKVHEKNFFLGNCYLKLKRNDLAYDSFKPLTKIEAFAPAAYFYLGLIDFQNDRLEPAERSFRKVLEISKDEELDQAAQAYLKQIEEQKALQEAQQKKFTLTGILGAQYNSSILTVAPNALPTALNGYRLNYGFGGEWRPLLSAKEEFLVQAQLSDMNSFDQNFKKNTTFNNFDPFMFQLQAPYRWKGLFNDQNSLVSASPFYRSIHMDPTGSGGRKEVISSLGIISDLSLFHTPQHSGYYALELRKDNILLDSISSDDDQNAMFVGINTTQTLLPKEEGVIHSWLLDGGLGFNQAQGKNQRYWQALAGGGLMRPWLWEALWITKLTTQYRNFFQSNINRKDTLLQLQALLQKRLNQNLQGSMILSYQHNESNLAVAKFDQWMLMGQLVWQTRF